jgi:hypothetical protein
MKLTSFVVLGFLIWSRAGSARELECGRDLTDAGFINAVERRIGKDCRCASPSHRATYESCVARTIAAAIHDRMLRETCANKVRSLAFAHTCHAPHAITCCSKAGACSITEAATCTAPKTVGMTVSCMDACGVICDGRTSTPEKEAAAIAASEKTWEAAGHVVDYTDQRFGPWIWSQAEVEQGCHGVVTERAASPG